MESVDAVRTALVDRYVIEEEVGVGATAHVYRARDLSRGHDVALKLLRPEFGGATVATRFIREVEFVRSLSHPNILPLYDSGLVEGRPYYTMPLIAGGSLRERLRGNQLPVAELLSIAKDVAAALNYAHQNRIVHRDVKPGNILLSVNGAVVADFGIARAITVAAGERLTDSGMAVGTPEYMSPEQGAGDAAIDGRADLYALGCVVFEMIAGEPPFTGPTTQAIIARHRYERPPSLHVMRTSIGAATQQVIERALAKEPAGRYSSALDFADALERSLAEPDTAAMSSRKRWMHVLANMGAAIRRMRLRP